MIRSTLRPAREFGTGKPLFWKDAQGNPDVSRPQKKSLVVTVYVPEERDLNNPVDDGIRTIWITQGATARPDAQGNWIEIEGSAFGEHCKAMEAAGVPRTLPEPGGYYYLCQTGTAPGKGQVDRKLWLVNYQRPTQASLAELDRHIGTAATQPVADDMAGQSPAVDANPYGNGQHQQAPSAPPAPPQGQPTYQPPAASQQPQYAPQQRPAPPQGRPAYANNGAPPARPQQHQSPPPPPQPQYAAGPYQ